MDVGSLRCRLTFGNAWSCWRIDSTYYSGPPICQKKRGPFYVHRNQTISPEVGIENGSCFLKLRNILIGTRKYRFRNGFNLQKTGRHSVNKKKKKKQQQNKPLLLEDQCVSWLIVN
jgi:hypothetical protein